MYYLTMPLLDNPGEFEQRMAPVPGPLYSHAISAGFVPVVADEASKSLLLFEPVTGDCAYLFSPELTDAAWNRAKGADA